MRNAYALLGLSFFIVFTGAYIILNKANAPTLPESEVKEISQNNMKLTSPNFEHNGTIPPLYTCDGDNTNPELHISEVPEGTGSLVLVMDDPDIPQAFKDARGIDKFDHWVLYNIPADTTVIPAGGAVGTTGENTSGSAAYTGPCPPTDNEPTEHRYIFRLYALPGQLNFIKAPTLDEVETAAKGSALDSAELIGLYDRTTN